MERSPILTKKDKAAINTFVDCARRRLDKLSLFADDVASRRIDVRPSLDILQFEALELYNKLKG